MRVQHIKWILCAPLALMACGDPEDTRTDAAERVPRSVSKAVRNSNLAMVLHHLHDDGTLAGADDNGNGVRDDIEDFIAALPDTDVQKDAVAQASAAIRQLIVVDTHNPQAMTAAMREVVRSCACLYVHYPPAVASARNFDIEKITLNTKRRSAAYKAFVQQVGAVHFTLPMQPNCNRPLQAPVNAPRSGPESG